MTRRELAAQGIGPAVARRLVDSGELRRIAPGIFVLGPEPTDLFDAWQQRCAIALRRGGTDAVLARESAAVLWDLDGFEPPAAITVNVPRASGRRGAAIRRVEPLEPPGEQRGLAVTSVTQTLMELGDDLPGVRVCTSSGRLGQWLSPADRLELAVESALRRLLVRESDLLTLVETLPRHRRGLRLLDEVVRRRPPGQPATESYLETRCVQVLRNAGLPTGRRQVDIIDDRRHFVGRVDLQLAARVIVEVDGREHHGDDRYEADRRRWTRLSGLGYGLGVFSWEQIEFEPAFVARLTADLLSHHRTEDDT